jgi:hypothetical protein
MGAAKPWMKFYPRDWRADEKLRLCSLGARGLWMELIALMHGSDRYGFLLIGGKPPSPEQIAVQVGAPVDEVVRLLDELRAAGVYSVSTRGVIASRRMQQDAIRSSLARDYGKRGGNPNLRKQTEKTPGVKGQDNAGLKLRGQRPESVSKETAGNPEKSVFDQAVEVLAAKGTSPSSARSFVGRLRKDHGDDKIAAAFTEARRLDISDPKPWVVARLARVANDSDALLASINRTYGGGH